MVAAIVPEYMQVDDAGDHSGSRACSCGMRTGCTALTRLAARM